MLTAGQGSARAPGQQVTQPGLRGSMPAHALPDLAGQEARLRYQVYRCEYLRYEAYSRLQATSVAIGESFPIPEIVAIGGQSDGKSSLLEAFLGFRFNVREVEMGTRRPLIVQMYHDPTAQEPRCRLQEEDTDEYGPVVAETAVADTIVKRTEEHLRRLGGGATVSSKPIVMKVEYAFCPNLTIIDTPGFILKAKNGEADRTPEDILAMVKAQAAPAHRLILFLQQSSVEWASSLWLNVVQEVDPTFQRTVFVASKFDNRLKEFAERWEVDKYLAATGYLPASVRPFFVALPKDRAIQTSVEWRRQMAEVDATIFRHLRENVKGGFDEERFGSRIGFNSLKKFLEEELARRYREAAPHTLAVLADRVDAASRELARAESELRSAEDVAALRATAMRFASSVASGVEALLEGSADPDPSVHGMTTDEERAACGARLGPGLGAMTASGAPLNSPYGWPGAATPVVPPNAGLKLYGGAAFERALHEFQEAAHTLRFPAAVATDRVANLLLAYKARSAALAPGRAAEDIARTAAKEVLGPLLDTAVTRLGFVLRRAFEVAAERAVAGGSSKDTLRPYVSFHAALRNAHHAFLARLEESTRAALRATLDAATSEFAVNLLASLPDTYCQPPDAYYDGAGAEAWGGQGEQDCDHALDQDVAGASGAEAGDATVSVQVSGGGHRTPGAGAGGAPGGVMRHPHLTIPETPAPAALLGAQQGEAGVGGQQGGARRPPAGVMPGPGRLIDNSPSKRAPKSLRSQQQQPSRFGPGEYALMGAPYMYGHKGYGQLGDHTGVPGSYEDVIRRAEKLFNRLRFSVAQQSAPTTLKASFLDPIQARLSLEVSLDLFARPDADFMQMFTAASALQALQARRDTLQKRTDSLIRLKNEFQELSRVL